MAKTIKIEHISWRNGKPRFNPSKTLRDLGFKSEILKHTDGTWFNAQEALEWVEVKKQSISAYKADIMEGKKRRVLVKQQTLGELFSLWFKSPKMNPKEASSKFALRKPLKPQTIRDYINKAGIFEEDFPTYWASSPATLNKQAIVKFYERLYEKRGISMASGVIAVLSSCLTWGIETGLVKREVNPIVGMRLKKPAPRVRALQVHEVHHLIKTADALGLPEIGDSIMLGVWTGQRQGDRLLMQAEFIDGRISIRQSKTNAPVSIKQSSELLERVRLTQERRRAEKLDQNFLILDERNNKPFLGDHYRKKFIMVRKMAVKGIKTAGVKPMLSLFDATDQDLRDTAVTWLARAGCSELEIISITGHSLMSAKTVLKHYYQHSVDVADNAVDKLSAWFKEQKQMSN